MQSSLVVQEVEAAEAERSSVLILNYRGLKELPTALLESRHCQSHLKKLYLKRNFLCFLPPSTAWLQALTELYLHSNEFKQLPSELSLLPCLETLSLECNHIVTLSPAVGSMLRLKCLNISRNCITCFPDELWSAPSLRQLAASGNQLHSLSPAIIYCQSLQRLLLDCNHLSSLPLQVTRLPCLEELSLCGNDLRILPQDMSGLQRLQLLYVDDNRELSCLPASLLLSTHLDLTVGTQGCQMQRQKEDHRKVLFLHTPPHTVPPLLELVARTIHAILTNTLDSSPLLWLPLELCSLLAIPNSLEYWLVPKGRCCHGDCGQVYFSHCYVCSLSDSLLLSLGQRVWPQHWGTGEQQTMAAHFCCRHCVVAFFGDQSDLLPRRFNSTSLDC